MGITLLALLALGVSTYLTWATWQQSTIAGCSGGSMADCDEVLTSAGSKWLGIPVSLAGALTYVAILALIWPAVLRGGWSMTALLALTMLAAGSGVWFIGTQALVLQQFCKYCMVVHTCGLLISTATIFLLRTTPGENNHDHMRAFFGPQDATPHVPLPQVSLSHDAYQPLIAMGFASLGLIALIGGQVFFAADSMEIVETPPLEIVDEPAVVVEGSPAENPTTVEPENLGPVDDSVVASDEHQQTSQSEQEVFADQGEPEAGDLEVLATLDGDSKATGQSFDSLFADTPSDVPRRFRLQKLKREIDAAGNPVVGNPYAPLRFVELMDYTCTHCRKLHPFIKSAAARYGDGIGFVIYHVPLSRKCNQLVKFDQPIHHNACDYAKLAYGVWKLAPEKFEEYHDWLLTGDRAPALHEAKRRAMQLAGERVLFDKSLDSEANRRIGEHAEEFQSLNTGLPILVFEGGFVRGMPASEQQWFEMLEQRVGLRPVANVTN